MGRAAVDSTRICAWTGGVAATGCGFGGSAAGAAGSTGASTASCETKPISCNLRSFWSLRRSLRAFEKPWYGGGVVAQHESDLGVVLLGVVDAIDGVAEEVAGALLKEEMLGHLVDQDLLIDADGLVFFDEGGVEWLKLNLVVLFLLCQANSGAEAMAERVLTDGGFAVGGARSRETFAS